MRIGIGILSVVLNCSAAGLAAEQSATTIPTTGPTTAPVQIGAFDITFTQRSRQSEYSKLLERLGTTKDAAGPDYDLKDQPLTVYVPADYDGGTSFGLMVQSFQDGNQAIDDSIRPVLDAHHLIAIATKKDHLPFATNAGVCLDAVYNMEQRYAIDSARVYLMGLSKPIMPIGMCTGDVFTGDVYCWWYDFYGPINGLTPGAPPTQYKPTPTSLRLARSHMQVLEFHPSHTSLMKALPGTMRQDGFEHVYGATMDYKDFLETGWFEGVVKKLESVRATPPRAHGSVAGTQPSPDEPQRLLGLAQAYISSNRPDLARAKLESLISKYPDSPEAPKAKSLLDQISAQ